VDCSFICHKSGGCTRQVLSECLPNAGKNHLNTLASFNVPHAFNNYSCMHPAWCVHCGRLVFTGISNKSNFKCRECGKWCHAECIPYVPPHCGLTKNLRRVLPLTTSLDSMQHVPNRLASYQFIRTIGRGSFGKVIVAKARDSGRLVAIKILKKADIMRHGETQNVQVEYRILNMIKRFSAPFCISLLDVIQSEDRVYLVSEFVAGGDLMFHIQNRPFSETQVQFIAAQMVLGLGWLHKHGVIYRDLKLDNVLVGTDGYIKLADFGLSRDGMLADDAMTNTFCGTPEFMAPEVIKEQSYGRAVDWWAFGVCLYELLLCQV
jgi:novel protein kinase C epsilon type